MKKSSTKINEFKDLKIPMSACKNIKGGNGNGNGIPPDGDIRG